VNWSRPTDSGSTENARLENRKLFKILFKLLYLRFPPLQIRTGVFRTCIFHPCIFVLKYSVFAYSILQYFRFPYLRFQSPRWRLDLLPSILGELCKHHGQRSVGSKDRDETNLWTVMRDMWHILTCSLRPPTLPQRHVDLRVYVVIRAMLSHHLSDIEIRSRVLELSAVDICPFTLLSPLSIKIASTTVKAVIYFHHSFSSCSVCFVAWFFLHFYLS